GGGRRCHREGSPDLSGHGGALAAAPPLHHRAEPGYAPPRAGRGGGLPAGGAAAGGRGAAPGGDRAAAPAAVGRRRGARATSPGVRRGVLPAAPARPRPPSGDGGTARDRVPAHGRADRRVVPLAPV